MRSSLLFLCILLCGCGPSLPTSKTGSYLTEERKRVPAKTIELSIAPSVSMGEKTLSSLMPIPLSALITQWSREHFLSDALEGKMSILVEEAEVKEVPLHSTSGFLGFSSSSQAKEKYVARITISLYYDYPGTARFSPSKVSVQTERCVPEGCTIQDRRYILSLLCEEILMLLTKETDNLLTTLFSTSSKRP